MESAVLSRSARIKRGFNRIAIAGAAVAAVCALWWSYAWFSDSRSDLRFTYKGEYFSTPDDTTEKVRSALMAKFGVPEPNQFDEFAPIERRGAYGPLIADARFNKAMSVRSSRDTATSIALLGLGWVGVFLLISWLIRGFMA